MGFACMPSSESKGGYDPDPDPDIGIGIGIGIGEDSTLALNLSEK